MKLEEEWRLINKKKRKEQRRGYDGSKEEGEIEEDTDDAMEMTCLGDMRFSDDSNSAEH